jgi:hypothetical protein
MELTCTTQKKQRNLEFRTWNTGGIPSNFSILNLEEICGIYCQNDGSPERRKLKLPAEFRTDEIPQAP